MLTTIKNEEVMSSCGTNIWSQKCNPHAPMSYYGTPHHQ